MAPRGTEQNALRDFRWSHTHPIAFHREYAKKEITRRAADASQPQDQRGQGNVMENPGGISFTSGDRERKLEEQLKESKAATQTVTQELEDEQERNRTVTTSLSEAKKKIGQLEDTSDRDKREMRQTRASHKDEIKAERKKAKMEERRESKEEREEFNRWKAGQETTLKKREVHLGQRQANFDVIEAATHEREQADALKNAEEAYVGRCEELTSRQRELEQGQANLEEDKAMYGSKIADAENAARERVNTANEALHASAAKDRATANAHVTEAFQLRKNAAKVERDAMKNVEYLSQKYSDMLQSSQSALEQMSNQMGAALRAESNAAIAEFQEKQKNADYRERVERSSYDNYHEVWETLNSSSLSLTRHYMEVAYKPRLAAIAWEEAAQFDASTIHPSSHAKYANLTSKIKRFLDSECELATLVADRAEQSARDFGDHASREIISGGHYSRIITRFHRFDKSQSNAEMARISMAVFGEPLLANLQRDTERELLHISKQLKMKPSEARVQSLNAKADKLRRDWEPIKPLQTFLADVTTFEILKALRDDSDLNKKVYFATRDLADIRRAITRPWIRFLSASYSDPDSGVDTEEHSRDRREIKRLHGDMHNEFDICEKSIREQCILEQQLGEGGDGEEMIKINAKIDGEMESAEAGVRSGLERLVRQRSPRPPAIRTRLSAAPATLVRPAGPGRFRGSLRAPLTAGDSKIARRPTDNEVVKLPTQKLRGGGNEQQNDKHDLEKSRLKRVHHELEAAKSKRLVLERDPKASPGKLIEIDRNIRGLERKLAGTGPVVQERELSGRERRPAKRTARSPMNWRPNATSESDSLPSNTFGGTSTPNFNFTPTASKQAWHPFWSNGKTTSQRSNAPWISTLPGVSRHSTVVVPNVLQVYSLHSLHETGIHEELDSDPEESPELRSTSILPTTSSFDDPITRTQSSIETASDPESASESDASYEPSDTEASNRDSTSLDLPSQAVDMDASPSPMLIQESVDAAESQPATLSSTPAAVGQVDANLSYNISTEDYRKAAMASPSTNAAFWSYKLYKNVEGKTPTIHYCVNLESAEAQAKQFLKEPVLGFDLEWEMGAWPGKASTKDCASLVQIASETKIGLFQLALFKGNTAEQLMPPSLRQILESQEITKTGVNVSGDASRIEKCFGLKVRGLFELSHLYNVVTWSESYPERVNKKLFNLADQVQNVLLLPLKKDKVRTSQWSKKLRLEQTEYAASDAYAGFRLYHTLEARRKKMSPVPPRPAFWEEKKPLMLADGIVVVPKKKKKVSADGKVIEVDEDDEEYFDAVETQDPYQLDPVDTTGIALGGLSISYPTLPTLEDEAEQLNEAAESEQNRPSSAGPTTATAVLVPTKEDPKPRPTTLSSPAVTQADSWAQTFRNALPANHLLKTKQAHLRAYHLWHYQNHDCKAVAALLRDPPLGLNTVASYVLQSVSMGKDLDFDKDRFTAAVELLPRNIQPKYLWVIERLERVESEREVGRGYSMSVRD